MSGEVAASERKPKKVLVIYTGGTIGMVPESEIPGAALAPASMEELRQYIPNPLSGIHWELRGLEDENGEPLKDKAGETLKGLDSSSVGPDHWVHMARSISRHYNEYEAFIVLHGTDTMAYTASALSFLLQNLDKPVVVTGSQLPIFMDRTDAKQNFINALYVAGYFQTGLPRIPEVVICFGDAILRGNRTTKVSTARWQGFDTPNTAHLGKIGEHIIIERDLLQPRPNENASFFAHTELEKSVAAVPIYPGISDDVLRTVLKGDVKGFVLRTFGNGNAPEDKKFLQVIEDAVQEGKIIVNTTQCVEGTVEMGLYAASAGLQEAGVISGLDLTPEAALTKLMWLLAAEGGDISEVRTQMQIGQRGEQTGSVFEVRYGPVGTKKNAQSEAKMAQRPSGQFATADLDTAILRLSGFGAVGSKPEDVVKIKAFVNLPGANANTPDNVPQYAGELSIEVKNPGEDVTLRDITSVVARVHETGRPLHISLIPTDGQKIWASSVTLNLFCGSR